MNCPSRNDDIDKHPDWNQAPPPLTSDLTTRADLNGISNLRVRDHEGDSKDSDVRDVNYPVNEKGLEADKLAGAPQEQAQAQEIYACSTAGDIQQPNSGKSVFLDSISRLVRRAQEILFKYLRFIGPGFLIAVAYIDPGNYATDVNGT